MPTVLSDVWAFDPVVVRREDLPQDDGPPALALLRHPDYPFRALIDDAPAAREGELRAVAEAYLGRVAALDAQLQAATALLGAGHGAGFGWLPITWDEGGAQTDPTGSFIVQRSGGAGPDAVVLLAGNRQRADGGAPRAEGMGVGLRVVLQWGRARTDGRREVRVTSMTASRLAHAFNPVGNGPRALVDSVLLTPDSLAALWAHVAAVFGLLRESVAIDGFEHLQGNSFRVAGTGARTVGPGTLRGYQWQLQLDLEPFAQQRAAAGGSTAGRQLVEQVSNAHCEPGPSTTPVTARLFLRDAATAGPPKSREDRSPTRSEARLNLLRRNTLVPPCLQDPAHDPPRYEVRRSPVGEPGADPREVQHVDPAQLPLRTDHLSAAHAYRRAEELFSLLGAVGLDAPGYFKFAKLPLLMRHRAGFDRHPDGRSINAQVRVEGPPLAYLSTPAPPTRPSLSVCFGQAALRHRALVADGTGQKRAQPMGLAADPRWAWHEFGHVLDHAATGALELHFVHSVGDALAALLGDCGSPWRDRPRGDTFPWVGTGRRHDREASLGWCWCGSRNGLRRVPLRLPVPMVKGYVEEQMLSSSIFRLYQATGGDTRSGPPMRTRCAHAVAYRVLRALTLCGPGGVAPVASVDQFLTALIDADIGSPARAASDDVQGGCWHKVMRWAFERQGLFATDDPRVDVDGPGRPPPVDLWIADRRAPADGGYHPVPLSWRAEARWLADPDALKVAGDRVHVTVGNRGLQRCGRVTVRAWCCQLQAGPLAWTALAAVALPPIAGIDPGQTGQASFVINPAPGPRLVLAMASTLGDQANLDPAAALPTSAPSPPDQPRALVDLVANDNNLALRWLN